MLGFVSFVAKRKRLAWARQIKNYRIKEMPLGTTPKA